MLKEKQVRLNDDTWERLKIISVKEKKSMKQLIKEMVNDRENSRKS